MLGYDVFNPMEVVPELDCDLIRKKGEKIDYAIVKDGEPIMLVDCHHSGERHRSRSLKIDDFAAFLTSDGHRVG